MVNNAGRFMESVTFFELINQKPGSKSPESLCTEILSQPAENKAKKTKTKQGPQMSCFEDSSKGIFSISHTKHVFSLVNVFSSCYMNSGNLS